LKDDNNVMTSDPSRFTRRQFLGLTLLSGAVSLAAQRSSESYVYIGTYSSADRPGIFVYKMNPATGELASVGSASGVDSPSFLAIEPRHRRLYAVNEVDSAAVSAFSIDSRSGKLSLLGKQSIPGSGPAHLSVDATGRFVLVANYGSGSVAMAPIKADGTLGSATGFDQHHGKGVNPARQEGPHAHSITPDPANRFALACDLGLDKIFVYRLDLKGGKLIPNAPPSVSVKPGAGPRHLAFSSNGRYIYVTDEMGNTVTVFSYDPAHGSLRSLQAISTLPEDFSGSNTSADIHVAPSGRFLYSSNRGHDSLAMFRISSATGKLTHLGNEPSGGKTPRNFAIDPSGRFLFVANQDSNNVVVFRMNPTTGALTPTGHKIEVPKPVCIKFLQLPR
jgi:6-phosphogluconolactonase